MSELPDGWAMAQITDVADILDSQRVPLNSTERASRKGTFPYYGANGLVDHVDDYLFEGPHVLLAEDGGYFDEPSRGVAYPVDGRFWVNNHAHVLKPASGISTSFLERLLNSIDWMPHVGGTTRLKLTQGSLAQVNIQLPPLAEQRRIVAKIEALSARSKRARADLERVEALVERAKQAVLAAAYKGGPEVAIGEIADISSGFGFPKHEQGSEDGSIPFAKVGDISTAVLEAGGILKTARNHVSPEALSRMRARPVPAGSIVFAKIGEGLRLNRRALTTTPVALDNNCMALTPKQHLVTPEYLFHFMKTVDIAQFAVATTVPSVRRSDIANLMIRLPSLQAQAKITSELKRRLAAITIGLEEAQNAFNLLTRLDQSILAKAFRGELVPQDENDDPASVLLDRIRAERAAAGAPKRRGRKA